MKGKYNTKQLRKFAGKNVRVTMLKEIGGETVEGFLDEMSTLTKEEEVTLNGWFFVKKEGAKSFNFRASNVAELEEI